MFQRPLQRGGIKLHHHVARLHHGAGGDKLNDLQIPGNGRRRELDRQPNALVTQRDTVVAENGKTFVRVKSGSSYEKREVKLGAANDVEQVIISGVEKGAVLLRNPS